MAQLRTMQLLTSSQGTRQVTQVSVGEPLGIHSINFKVVKEKGWTGPQVKVLNWGKANFGGIRQELAEVDWPSLFANKGMSSRQEIFKSKLTRVQGQHVSARVKGTRILVNGDVKVLARVKKAYVRFRQMGSSKCV